jgi:hypothetical protein
MRLIFIYGLPGTGKLTVARALAERTGIRLCHNHLTVDLAASLYPHGSPEYTEFVRFLRLETFRRAAESDVDLIFTFWYSNISQANVNAYRAVIEGAGGSVHFVYLHCRPDVLETRVISPSRRGKKMDNVPSLRLALEEYGTADRIPGTHLEIDSSDLEPSAVAQRIVQHFGLEPMQQLASPTQ